MMKLFVEQPLASPGSAKYNVKLSRISLYEFPIIIIWTMLEKLCLVFFSNVIKNCKI